MAFGGHNSNSDSVRRTEQCCGPEFSGPHVSAFDLENNRASAKDRKELPLDFFSYFSPSLEVVTGGGALSNVGNGKIYNHVGILKR